MRIIQRINKLKARYLPPNKAYNNIKLISHHIPKTAGTSFVRGLEKAFGINNVYGLYETSETNKASQGSEIWVPNKAEIIHGHFRPHLNHQKYYPNAIRAIWLRDPTMRAISQLKHTLQDKQPFQAYSYLKKDYLDNGIRGLNQILELAIEDRNLYGLFRPYKVFFRDVTLDNFTFVGLSERFDEDLEVLSEILGVELTSCITNITKNNEEVSEKVRTKVKSSLETEYYFYNKVLNK